MGKSKIRFKNLLIGLLVGFIVIIAMTGILWLYRVEIFRAVSGLPSEKQIAKIQSGLSKDEVISILGKPKITYGENQFIYSTGFLDGYLYVTFKDGYVQWTSKEDNARGLLVKEASYIEKVKPEEKRK
jgi:outer membrane protein assembly factor BamE (lipoprotein component of BamABCDE complex)